MARKRRPLLLPAILILLLSSLFLYFALRVNGLPLRRIFGPSTTSASWSVLEEIRSISKLETASYEMKVVFPFDFIEDDRYVNWAFLKYQYDSDPRLFPAKSSPAWHPGGRLPPDWRHAGIYLLCRQVGIDPGRPDYRFVVMSVNISAGVDMETWITGFIRGEPHEDVGGIRIAIDDDGRKRIELPSPPVALTSFTVEDLDTSTEGYPDVPLSPESWGLLVDGLKTRLRDMAVNNGLLETADQRNRDFFTEIFTAAGYQDVHFTN